MLICDVVIVIGYATEDCSGDFQALSGATCYGAANGVPGSIKAVCG
jgi:hypothetical protein